MKPLFKRNGYVQRSLILACGNYCYATPSSSKFPFIKGHSKIDIDIFCGKDIFGFRLCGVLDV